ncbi:YggS family pyridoxal phosphate-dependent enzyme [Lachnoanaerobaculum sp. Marseille-Q4761]|uniref:YggS family pyridoxal phosphate-dependent enzyme n=1 Tax=Lachnoanaerobaculum sp. Marseille-Q4761 TaxID=2819511 RepID=UPI001AA1188F|nr:YggS family pyridoxal phosphate-dependent enzyme [Lachnoanaerobaculum sp. Marseille-Q4761]MBO1870927.1 YggS family pyridoxal phosphate-dependent enzyme [Lachnoanaerobaculum sp. Marseille-Q4761]
MVKDNLKNIRDEMNNACERSNRNLDDITLIAVSKTKPNELIMEAYESGVRDFGENKVQELLRKKEELPDDVRWHMIGHLQTNKVRQLLGNTVLIHSIDSIRLADTIDTEARKKGIHVDGLLEINIAKEASKYGFIEEELEEILPIFARYKNLHIKGLMTIAPNVENSEENRKNFKKLKKLSVDIIDKNYDNVEVEFLSMGMSGDYIVALEEGANLLRVGTGIFGKR